MYTTAMSFALQRRAMSGHCLNSLNLPLFIPPCSEEADLAITIFVFLK
jgi:hypothetical protein